MEVYSCVKNNLMYKYKDNISETIRNNTKLNDLPYTVKLILNNNLTTCTGAEMSPAS